VSRPGGGTVRVRIYVSGRVQGVWFRESCREQADAAHVAGFVRNLADGRVHVEVEGRPAAVSRVVAWCREGPRRARVDTVETAMVEPIGDAGFRVL
jgi:acylphosphatase